MKIGFVGAGQMAQALATGIARARPDSVFYVADPAPAAVEAFQASVGACEVRVCDFNDDVGAEAEVLFLAVKPQYFNQACDDMPRTAAANPLTISVATGITLVQLAKITGIRKLIRVMPNTPALIGQGAASFSPGKTVAAEDIETARSLLEPIGDVHEVPESLIDAVVGVSGSGPAYVFSFIEALSDGGVMMGLPRTLANQFAIQTVLGAAELLKQSGEHPAILRDRVASPGGTTIAALESLEKNSFRYAVMSAVRAAAEKSQSLGEQRN